MLMDVEWSLTVAGLSADIVGIVVLFVTTSARRIEAESITRANRHVLEESKGGEWIHERSYEEMDEEVRESEKRNDRNRCLQRGALFVIVVGFLLQLLGQLL